MVVGLSPRRNPYGPPPLFSAEDVGQAPSYMGFLDVAGQPNSIPALPGVGLLQPSPPAGADQPETFEPIQPQQQQGGDATSNDLLPSEASIDRRMKLAEALLGKQQEVNHPLQAIGNAVSQITGAYLQNKAQKDRDKISARRLTSMKSALGQGGDLAAIADRLMASDDPDLVEKGLALKMESIKSSQGDASAPTTRNFYEGGGVVTKQWNAKTRSWDQIGDVQPRWKGRAASVADESGGDASYDDDGTTGKRSDPTLLDDETIDFMADQYMAGDRSVLTNLGRGKSGVRNIVALRKRIAERAREVDPETGQPRMSARQLASAQAELQGYGAYMRTTETQSARMRGAAEEARSIGKDVLATSQMVPRSNLRLINWTGNQFRAQTGDPNVVRFAAALNSYINVYARAINPTGQPTMADKEHARELITTAMSQGQVEAAIGQLDRELQAAIAAPREVRNQRRDEYYSGDKEGPEAPPPMQVAPQRQGPQRGEIVRGYRFKGGDPRNKANWERVS